MQTSNEIIRTAFITGVNGFAGQWLSNLLLSRGYAVCGIDLQECAVTPSVRYRKADLLDEAAVAGFIDTCKPGLLFHLAAVSFLPAAEISPRLAMDANISGTLILCDAVRKVSPDTRLLIVGSSKQYPDHPETLPVSETCGMAPENFYGISKLSAELIGRQYFRQFGIDVRCARSFNHTGPGQSPKFVCSEWARQTARIALGLAEPVIKVGETDTGIDFCDVRDVVDAYVGILTGGMPGDVYNVCSGTATELQWILDYLTAKSGRAVTIERVSDRVRMNTKTLRIAGSFDKLRAATGWTPSIPLRKTLDDLYDWWIKQLSRSPA